MNVYYQSDISPQVNFYTFIYAGGENGTAFYHVILYTDSV